MLFVWCVVEQEVASFSVIERRKTVERRDWSTHDPKFEVFERLNSCTSFFSGLSDAEMARAE
jgi:hypothetical protein